MWFKKDSKKSKTAQGIEYLEIPGEEDGVSILLLHGFGASYEDLVPLSEVRIKGKRPRWIFPQGPKKISTGLFETGRAWFNIDIPLLQQAFEEQNFAVIQQAFPSIDPIRQQLEKFITELNISSSELIIGGFSQGAVLATELAFAASKSLKGLVVFSGTLIHQEKWQKQALQHSSLAYLQTHGIEDPLLPFSLAKDLNHLFDHSGLSGTFHTFEGGHEIDDSSLQCLRRFLNKLC